MTDLDDFAFDSGRFRPADIPEDGEYFFAWSGRPWVLPCDSYRVGRFAVTRPKTSRSYVYVTRTDDSSSDKVFESFSELHFWFSVAYPNERIFAFAPRVVDLPERRLVPPEGVWPDSDLLELRPSVSAADGNPGGSGEG